MLTQVIAVPHRNHANQTIVPDITPGTVAQSRQGVIVGHPEGTVPGAHRGAPEAPRDAPEARRGALRATNVTMTNRTTTASGRRPCAHQRQRVTAPVPVTTRSHIHRSTTLLPTGTNRQPLTYPTQLTSLTTRSFNNTHPTTLTTKNTNDSSCSQKNTTACSTK